MRIACLIPIQVCLGGIFSALRAYVYAMRARKGKREYLNDKETECIMKEIQEYFESKIDLPLIRRGKSPRINTLINKEAFLARNENKSPSLTRCQT